MNTLNSKIKKEGNEISAFCSFHGSKKQKKFPIFPQKKAHDIFSFRAKLFTGKIGSFSKKNF